MRCVIIDDEQAAIGVIQKFIIRLPDLEVVGTATNPLIGIEIIKKEKPDVVFLDIQMRKMNGIEVMKNIPGSIAVVFCTAYSEFAVQSYELNAVDYLMKPIEFPRFALAVQRVTDLLTSKHTPYKSIPNDYIFVRAGQRGKMQRIDLDDIFYIEAMHNYSIFHLPNTTVITHINLKDLEDELPEDQFVRIHRSYIVSVNKVSSLTYEELVIKKGKQHLPIGVTYREAFLERMKSKLLDFAIGFGCVDAFLSLC